MNSVNVRAVASSVADWATIGMRREDSLLKKVGKVAMGVIVMASAPVVGAIAIAGAIPAVAVIGICAGVGFGSAMIVTAVRVHFMRNGNQQEQPDAAPAPAPAPVGEPGQNNDPVPPLPADPTDPAPQPEVPPVPQGDPDPLPPLLADPADPAPQPLQPDVPPAPVDQQEQAPADPLLPLPEQPPVQQPAPEPDPVGSEIPNVPDKATIVLSAAAVMLAGFVANRFS